MILGNACKFKKYIHEFKKCSILKSLQIQNIFVHSKNVQDFIISVDSKNVAIVKKCSRI